MDKRRMGGWLLMIAALLGGCAAAKVPEPTSALATAPAAETQAAPAADYPLPPGGRVVDAVAMTVNGEVVTLSDLLVPIRDELRDAARTASPAEFMAAASGLIGEQIQRQIDQALILAEARRRFSDAQKAYIDSLVDDRIREMVLAEGGSRRRLEARLLAEGGSLEQTTRSLRREMLGQLYLHGQLGSDLDISCRDLWQYYQTHGDEFSSEPTVTMRILAMPFSAFETDHADPRQAAIDAAEAALARIRDGEDFADVVRDAAVSTAYRSDEGGLWEAMARGSFRETAVEDAAFAGEPGEVSDVIVGATGAFVVKTVRVDPGETVSFEQAQEEIRELLRTRTYRRLVNGYVRDLRRRAVIISNDALDTLARRRVMQLYDER